MRLTVSCVGRNLASLSRILGYLSRVCAPTQPCAYNMIKNLQARECGYRRPRTIEEPVKKIIRENEPVSEELAALRRRKASNARLVDMTTNWYLMCHCANHFVSCQYLDELRRLHAEAEALKRRELRMINLDYWARYALRAAGGL